NTGPAVVRELKGVVCDEDPDTTIGILVSPFLNFTDKAIDTAKKSCFPIILTDKSHIPLIILNIALDNFQNRSFEFPFYHNLVFRH
ncbi:16992_t:CDS:1, partial [Racocetra persica]